MVIQHRSAHDMLTKQQPQLFPRRDRPRPGLTAKDAGVVLVYRPKDPNEDSVVINGMTIDQNGLSHVGPHPELKKWVNKVLRVEVKLPNKEERVPAIKSPLTNAAQPPVPTRTKAPKAINQAEPVKRGAPPTALEVVQSIRQKEMKMLGQIPADDNNVSASQTAIESSVPEATSANPDLELVNLDAPDGVDQEALALDVAEAAAEADAEAEAYASQSNEESSVNFSNEASSIDESDLRVKCPKMPDLRVFAAQYDLKSRNYEDLIIKLISIGAVRDDSEEKEEAPAEYGATITPAPDGVSEE